MNQRICGRPARRSGRSALHHRGEAGQLRQAVLSGRRSGGRGCRGPPPCCRRRSAGFRPGRRRHGPARGPQRPRAPPPPSRACGKLLLAGQRKLENVDVNAADLQRRSSWPLASADCVAVVQQGSGLIQVAGDVDQEGDGRRARLRLDQGHADFAARHAFANRPASVRNAPAGRTNALCICRLQVLAEGLHDRARP